MLLKAGDDVTICSEGGTGVVFVELCSERSRTGWTNGLVFVRKEEVLAVKLFLLPCALSLCTAGAVVAPAAPPATATASGEGALGLVTTAGLETAAASLPPLLLLEAAAVPSTTCDCATAALDPFERMSVSPDGRRPRAIDLWAYVKSGDLRSSAFSDDEAVGWASRLAAAGEVVPSRALMAGRGFPAVALSGCALRLPAV